jgi:rhamnosyltransferase
MKNAKFVAVVVAYNPSFETFGLLIERCVPQVEAVVVVNNGAAAPMTEWLERRNFTTVTHLPLPENEGVARAQNVGLNWAKQRGATHVFLFDHDSIPDLACLQILQTTFVALEASGKRVAAVGARHIDSRRNREDAVSPFVRLENGLLKRCLPEVSERYVAVDFLIASGSLISAAAIEAVGPMNDKLFIEYVDVEWGLRARRGGWSLYGVMDAVIEHSLGDDHVMAWGREIAVHSPLRHYYVMRNALWLCFQPWLLKRWKGILALNMITKFLVYAIFMPDPLKHLRCMCRGFWHAATGRMGRL